MVPGWRMDLGKRKGLFRIGLGRSERRAEAVVPAAWSTCRGGGGRWRGRRGCGGSFSGGRRRRKPGAGRAVWRRRAVARALEMGGAFSGGMLGLRACGGPFPMGGGVGSGSECGGLFRRAVRALPSLPSLRAAGGGGRWGPGASRRSRCPKAGRAPAVCPARRSPAPAPSPARGRRGAWPRR